MIPNIILQILVMPLLASITSILIGRRLGKEIGWVSGVIQAYSTVLLLVAGWKVVFKTVREEYIWITLPKVKFAFLIDNLNWPIAFVLSLICTCMSFYSIEYVKQRIEVLYGSRNASTYYGLYYAFYPLFHTGLLGIVFSENLILVWFFMEFLLVPSYFLIAYFGYEERYKTALMCFLYGTAGASLFLIGILLAYTHIGTFSINAMSKLNGLTAYMIIVLILLGLLIKMSIFGFHVWTPWVEGECPTSIAGILACYANIGTYLIVRILIQPLSIFFQLLSIPIMVWALITMVYGAFLALSQDDVKRLCACSTISQIAYSLIGIGSLTSLGISGGILYFLSHCLGKTLLFSSAGLLVYETEIRDIRKLGGLAQKLPETAILWFLGSMILSALPPLSGFQAEWLLFAGIFQKSIFSSIILIIAILVVTATILTVVYTFWPMKRIFFGETREHLENIRNPPRSMIMSLIPLIIVSLLIGIYPQIFMKYLTKSLF